MNEIRNKEDVNRDKGRKKEKEIKRKRKQTNEKKK